MRRLFVDTSGWLALRDPRHRKHAYVIRFLESFRGRIVTTSDILDEVVAWATRRWGHNVALGLIQRIRDPQEVQFVFIEEAFFEEALELFRNRKDKRYSLTDCTSFVVMDRLQIGQVLTLDDDFKQEGFETVPGPDSS